MKKLIFLTVTFFVLGKFFAQDSSSTLLNKIDIDYKFSKTYSIGGMVVVGLNHIEEKTVLRITKLIIDQEIKVPGVSISNAIKNLWNSKLFSNVSINYNRIDEEKKTIFLEINIKERTRISKFRFTGVKKRFQKDLRGLLSLVRGKVITKELLIKSEKAVKDFYISKGFYNTSVNIKEKKDLSLKNANTIDINVASSKRIKIKKINFTGNKALESSHLKLIMAKTKQKAFYRIFKSSKFIPEEYNSDKKLIINYYNEIGYRDAYIVSDSLYKNIEGDLMIDIKISEGKKYYFRNISWVGNTIHPTAILREILGVKKGDVYNKKALEVNLFSNQKGPDVTSLYMDDGYLFFRITPIETKVSKDSVDIEIRISEGSQARVNNVTITGNVKTRDKVILREIRSLPGSLFSRSDIMRTIRELSQLGYFNPEKIGVVPKPNIEDGTVDINYTLEETQADQIQLAGGYNGISIVGKLGFAFKNFSLRNILTPRAWTPVPSGDGQTLSLNAQSSGINYQNYSLSFVEPWLGGKKPISLSASISHTVYRNSSSISQLSNRRFSSSSISIGIGKRLRFPDDYFVLRNELIYQYYDLKNYVTTFLANGYSHSFSLRTTLIRNSVNSPIYPRSGSKISVSLKLTPPYSLFSGVKDYSTLEPQERYKFTELHKLVLKSSWFTEIAPKLVLNTRFGFGFLGSYNSTLKVAFNKFYMGGSGLNATNNLDGRELIALRGYRNNDLSPTTGAVSAAKYVFELRYPISLNPSATIYALAFGEAGNTWSSLSKTNLFNVHKSVGFGFRIFLPIVGKLGLDLGYRLDDLPNSNPNKHYEIHFSLGGSISNW